MKFFKSFRGALVVTLLVVLTMTPVGIHRSALRARAAGETASVAVEASVSRYREIAQNLKTVALRYLAEDAVRGLDAADGATLTAACQTVLSALEAQPLTDAERGYLTGFRVDLLAQQDMIARAPYHALADGFNREVLGGVFVGTLAKLTGVAPLPDYTGFVS